MIDLQIGDSRKLIHGLTDASIDCVMTSPPYWGLRDYGHSDQIGLEKTPEEYLKTMLDLFDDVKLKLKDEGNCFVNLGDSYAGSGVNDGTTNAGISNAAKRNDVKSTSRPNTKVQGLKAKCLCMIPQRFAWGMIERGWILRNEIIWAKPNHMPESVTDRLTKSHEVIYHFVKQQKYYYDLDAIREPHKDSSMERYQRPLKMGGAKHAGKKGFEIYSGNEWKPEGYSGKFEGANNAESFGSPRARTQRKHQIGDGYRQGMNRDENAISIQRVHEVNQKEIAGFLRRYILNSNGDSIEETTLDGLFGEHTWRHWVRTDDSGASLPSPDDWLSFFMPPGGEF